jgi:hypothetical protein
MQHGPEGVDENSEESTVTGEASRSVVAYYFHGARRCDTCRTIEAYAAETLKSCFAEQMDDEKLTWSVINLSEADNEHFVQDFELSTRTIVLVEMQGGEQVRWKSLSRVWELVGDKEAFGEYIREETQGFLGG